MKRLNFLEGTEGLDLSPYVAVAADIWRDALKTDPACYVVNMFLEGLRRDLILVRKPAFPSYVGFLGFAGIDTDLAALNGTIRAFREHLTQVLSAKDGQIGDNVACRFISTVLQVRLSADPDLGFVITHLPMAVQFAALAAERGHYAGLSTLAGLIQQLVSAQGGIDRLRQEWPEALQGTYSELNKLHRRMPEAVRRKRLDPVYEKIVPVIDLERQVGRLKTKRKRTSNWTAHITIPDGDPGDVLEAAVGDVTVDGHGYLVALQRPGLCKYYKDEKQCELQADGRKYMLGPVDVSISTSEDTFPAKRARIERAWNYEEGYGQRTERVGIAVSFPDGELPVPIEIVQHLPAPPEEYVAERSAARRKSKSAYAIVGDPFDKGSKGILRGLVEWCQRVTRRLRQRGGWREYWVNDKPVDKATIVANLVEDLADYVESRRAILTTIPRGTGDGDLLVIRRGDDRVFVEVEPSGGRWREALAQQLPRLIQEVSEQPAAGLLVVFEFSSSPLPSDEAPDSLKQLYDRICKEAQLDLDVVIISCDRPAEPSVAVDTSAAGAPS